MKKGEWTGDQEDPSLFCHHVAGIAGFTGGICKETYVYS
jgi:hypothetical protein